MSDPTSSHGGVIDSIRDGIAVILVGDEETEHTVAADDLPTEAQEGSRVQVSLSAGQVTEVTVIEAAPSTEELKGRMERLKAERPSRLLRRRPN